MRNLTAYTKGHTKKIAVTQFRDMVICYVLIHFLCMFMHKNWTWSGKR